MRWLHVIILLPAILLVLRPVATGFAQNGNTAAAQSDVAAPADVATPSDGAVPPISEIEARTTADCFDTDLLELLSAQWGPVGKRDPGVTDPGNITVLSVPEGLAVYLADMSDLNSMNRAGEPVGPSMEEVVFTDKYFLGQTPLTAAVPPGNYTLAIRAGTRLVGFDGGCISKTTSDIITGGTRHTYHLYPLEKRSTLYQCFVANFAPADATADQLGLDLYKRGAFAFSEPLLVDKLSAETNAPVEERERLARRLNQLGVAFYSLADAEYLVKLSLTGNEPLLTEWRVE